VTDPDPIDDEEKGKLMRLTKVVEMDDSGCLSKCGLTALFEVESNVDDMDNLSSGEAEVDATSL
jgi:hypothetical protein